MKLSEAIQCQSKQARLLHVQDVVLLHPRLGHGGGGGDDDAGDEQSTAEPQDPQVVTGLSHPPEVWPLSNSSLGASPTHPR